MGRLALISLISLMTALSAPAALAKSPPKGDYGCTYTTFSGTFYAGTLNILSKKKYAVNDKGKGKYKTKGKKIKFKSGAYEGLWKGKWSKGKSVLNPDVTFYEIELRSIKDPDGTPTMSCTRDRS
jgi:hypothetical protein